MSALVAKELQEQNKLLEKIIGNYILDKIHPVGSVYISTSNISPASLFGGTWERIKDRFLLSAGDTYSAGTTGGESRVKLTAEQMPKHSHKMMVGLNDGWSADMVHVGDNKGTYTGYAININSTVKRDGNGYYTYSNLEGGDQSHNNMPPYLTVYMWKRTA